MLKIFREMSIKNYNLDPCWYYILPSLSWDALLKQTNVKLDLLRDENILLMIENGLGGGVSVIPNRYAKANNKYL